MPTRFQVAVQKTREPWGTGQGMLYHPGMTKRWPSIVDPHRAKEAKSIVAQCFRNGPIEDVHAGIKCPTCSGDKKYSHITQGEMKCIMKNAVNKVYTLLWLKDAFQRSTRP
ncbi:MAG: hypothetical protein ACHP8A_17420 [Terriglobales bacterium]|jgi:hypothetical protein|nr:hypothetical protein [Terriglobales bacterium]